MNLEVFALGTGGMMPLPNRHLTSAMIRRDGDLFLFDCGEGTQISLKKLNLKWKKIDSIFISHMHADHVTGLPGMLMLSSQVDRTEPLTLYGPPRLKDYVEANRKILDMYINYEIQYVVTEEGVVLDRPEYRVRAFKLDHSKPCMGYVFEEKERPGAFHPELAVLHKIPQGPLWGKLQKGGSITLEDGTLVTPDAVMGRPRQGRKIGFVTDTRYHSSIAKQVEGCDLLLCEGMFTGDLEQTAWEKKHMTATQAAMIARDAGVGKLGLIHYSPRYSNRELRSLYRDAKAVFPSTVLTKDQMNFEIPLKD